MPVCTLDDECDECDECEWVRMEARGGRSRWYKRVGDEVYTGARVVVEW